MSDLVRVKSKACPGCGGYATIEITEDQYLKLKSGVGHIQDVLPEISLSTRERFISGYCAHCWDRLFKDSDV